MKATPFALAAAAGLALAACDGMMAGQPTMDPITRAVSGNTLTRGDVAITVNTDGTLEGTTPAGEFSGTWTVQGEQWCDTIVEPADMAGTTCLNVDIGDGEITFINPDGSRGNTWEIS